MAAAILFLLSVVRALVEVAGLALLGQGIVGLLAGSRREGNPIYQLFRLITRPALAILRRIVPGFIPERQLPRFAFFVLFTLWILLAVLKRAICTAYGIACFA